MSTADLYCDHFNQFTDQEFQELFSEVAAIRAENKELFEFTHRPIEVFPSEEAGQSGARTVSEDEILDHVRKDRNRNYAVVIEGETGTGKSELCAYLVHNLRDERPVLRIDKDDDLMSILTKRLPEFYREHFDEPLPQEGAFKRLEKDITNNPQTVANYAVTGALLKFSKQEIETTYNRDDERTMVDVIEDHLDEVVSGKGDYGRERVLINKQQYSREPAFHVFGPTVSQAEAIDQWNTELWNVIRDEYDTPPLSEMLSLVGDEFTDTRPVVVFEDFSIASLEAKQLRNYIERDIAGDNWDFIIAGTRDVTQVMHSQTAEDRFEYFQTNKPNSNSVVFLDEDSAVDFIRPYLAYFKTLDGSVTYARNNGRHDFTSLQPAPHGSICDACGLCDDSYRDLFPFNATFLERIYAGLDESEQSPREYVSKVYEILEEFYLGGTNVPSSASALGSDVTNRETPADKVYDRQEQFADLAKWYGTVEGEFYVVDRAFATAFGLVPASREPGTLDADVVIEEETVRVPASDGASAEPGSGPGSDVSEGEAPAKSKVQRLYEERVGDVDDWIDDPGNSRFTETNNYIRTALTELINHVTDDYKLWTDGKLRYNLSSQKAPFEYEATATSLGDDQIILNTKEFRPSEVRELLKHGIRLEEAKDSADTDARLESLGTHITHYAREWRAQIRSQYVETPRVLYRKADRGRFDFDDFVIASYALLTLLDNPWERVTPEQLNRRYQSDEEFALDDGVKQQLRNAAAHDEYQAIVGLFEYADQFESLIGSRFGVISSALDVPAIRRRMGRASPSRILSALAQTYIGNISHRVRFSTDATLEDLATAAYRAQDTLGTLYDENEPFKIHKQVTRIFKDVDPDRIGAIASRLDTYDAVDPQFVEALSQFAALDSQEVTDLVDAATMLSDEFDPTDRQSQIQIMVGSMRISGSTVAERLQRIQQEWAEPTDTGSAKRFSEVSSRYVE